MKHIFMVHSHITYLAALGTITREKIADGDYLLLSEGYRRSDPVPVHPQIQFSNSRRYMLRHPLRWLQPDKATDRVIDDFIGDDTFTAYVNAFYFLSRVVCTHARCAGVHFIEEGYSAYRKGIPFDSYGHYQRNHGKRQRRIWESLLLLIRGFSFRLQSFPVFYDAYTNVEGIEFYGFSPDTFVGVAETRVVSFDQIRKRFPFPRQASIDGATLWIGDDIIEVYGYPRQYYKQCLEKGFITFLKSRGITEIVIKFHPGETAQEREWQLELFASYQITTRLIPDQVILETELCESQGVTLCGFHSSLMLYAAFMGHKSISFDRYLIPDANVSNEVKSDVFRKYVECL